MSKLIVITFSLLLLTIGFILGFYTITHTSKKSTADSEQIKNIKFTPPVDLHNPFVRKVSVVYSITGVVDHIDMRKKLLTLKNTKGEKLGPFSFSSNVPVYQQINKRSTRADVQKVTQGQFIEGDLTYYIFPNGKTETFISFIRIQ